ncbi:DUF805 domain-containing protein [Phenylobacterium sp.]|uniref:DUF805 domain-containing protein n=1 Tax=Phenylobacterium sp. TaxID=1871053 RepID=UPI00286CDB61|nr:DUF805 domain-containing protein [Phenylobacterium sp.]
MPPIRDLLGFQGRLSPLGYWRRILLLQALLAVAWCAAIFAIMAVGPIGGVLLTLLVPVFVGHVACVVRRLHDRNRGGAWLIPFVLGPWAMLGAAEPLLRSGQAGPGWIGVGLILAGLYLYVWGWVEIGFRGGSPGANLYGPLSPSQGTRP